jgi:hypothetical protein
MMEAVLTSVTSVYSNETTRRYVPEGFNLYENVVIAFKKAHFKDLSANVE